MAAIKASEKPVIVFVHGFSSSFKKTWTSMENLILHDPDLACFETYGFDYPSAKIRFPFKPNYPRIQTLAKALATNINTRFESRRITILAHSMGGLVARQYLLDEAKRGIPLRVDVLFLFATPNNGAELACIPAALSWRHGQAQQMLPDSEFLMALNEDWENFKLSDEIRVRYIIAGRDAIVNERSAQLMWGNANCSTIVQADHCSVTCPSDDQDMSYLVVKKFLEVPSTAPASPPVEPLVAELSHPHTSRAIAAAEALESLGEADGAVVSLIRASVSEMPELREAAAKTLAVIRPGWWNHDKFRDQGIKILVSALSTSDERARLASGLLREIGRPCVPDLAATLTDSEDDAAMIWAARTLRNLGESAAGAEGSLAAALGRDSSQVRLAAAEALGSLKSIAGPAVNDLARALADPDLGVRVASAKAIAAIGPRAEDATAQLLPLLFGQHEELRQAATDALVAAGAPVVRVMLLLLRTRKQRRILFALSRVLRLRQDIDREGPPPAGLPLRVALRGWGWRLLADQEKSLDIERGHKAAIEILGRVRTRSKAAIQLLEEVARSSEPDELARHFESHGYNVISTDVSAMLRKAAISALGHIGADADSALPTVVRAAATDRDDSVRTTAYEALDSIEPMWMHDSRVAELLMLLIGALQTRTTRPAAQRFLERAREAAIPALLSALNGEERAVRLAAVETLGRVGMRGGPICDELRRVATNDDEVLDVREAALEAIRAIEQAQRVHHN